MKSEEYKKIIEAIRKEEHVEYDAERDVCVDMIETYNVIRIMREVLENENDA